MAYASVLSRVALGLGISVAVIAAPIAGRAQGRAGAVPEPRPLPYQSRDKTMGVATCASSLCHGSIAEWRGSAVLQNEYVTWSRVDKHAGASKLLRNERSIRIGKNLGLKEPPEKAKVCLDCHAHNPDPGLADRRSHTEDGVSCEACHGPAQRWLAPHTAPGRTHAANVASGLYPLDSPVERARLCLSCHFGNEDRLVTHRMMGAGHPRLSFELETFSHMAPSHFRMDADYVARKGTSNGAKVWAIGQAMAVVQIMKLLKSPTRGRDGLFPEFVLFDCHTCHHPMSQPRFAPRTVFGGTSAPGTARVNDSNLMMLRAIMRRVDPAFADSLAGLTLALHRAVAGEGDVLAAASAVETKAAEAIATIAAFQFDDATLRDVTLALVDEGLSGHYSDYAAAEQSVMAIGSLLNSMVASGLARDPESVNRALRALRAPLASDEGYRPADWLPALREFRATLQTLTVRRQDAK
jgi:hypothetical protein